MSTVTKEFIRESLRHEFEFQIGGDLEVYEGITQETADFLKENVEHTPEVEKWINEMIEFEALMRDEPLEESSEKTVIRHQIAGAAIGTAVGAVIGGGVGSSVGGGLGAGVGAAFGGAHGAAAGSIVGTATGAAHAVANKLIGKGGQRVLADQIERGAKKIQKWRSEPNGGQKNREKIDSMNKKIQQWRTELQEMKKRGEGKAGVFRSSAEEKAAKRKGR